MRADVKLTALAAVTVICALSSAAWSEQVVHYGRAGGAVGADRLEELRSVQRSDQAMPLHSASPQRYGRAGGPIGADIAVAPRNPPAANASEATPHPTAYGRAGAPPPFGG